MDPIKIGDLVKDVDGHYGIVMDFLGNELTVFFGNGLPCIKKPDQLEQISLPNSAAPCNFLEVLAAPKWNARVRIQRG